MALENLRKGLWGTCDWEGWRLVILQLSHERGQAGVHAVFCCCGPCVSPGHGTLVTFPQHGGIPLKLCAAQSKQQWPQGSHMGGTVWP